MTLATPALFARIITLTDRHIMNVEALVAQIINNARSISNHHGCGGGGGGGGVVGSVS